MSDVTFSSTENQGIQDIALGNLAAQTNCIECRLRCMNLIVLGLPLKTTDASFCEYFESMGEVLNAEIKKDSKTGKSRGFGFIRFALYEVQLQVLSTKHKIDGRWCFVKVYVYSKEKGIQDDNSTAKTNRIKRGPRCTELIVLGLPWKTSEASLREYFESIGAVLEAWIKKEPKAAKAGRFGFVRFVKYDAQMKALATKHMIDGRWCNVKVYGLKEDSIQLHPLKVFVGRSNAEITADDLKNYFAQYGEITEVFIPTTFRAFCVVTFLDPNVVQSLCGDHTVQGVSVWVSKAESNDHSAYDNNYSHSSYQRGYDNQLMSNQARVIYPPRQNVHGDQYNMRNHPRTLNMTTLHNFGNNSQRPNPPNRSQNTYRIGRPITTTGVALIQRIIRVLIIGGLLVGLIDFIWRMLTRF